MDLWSAREHFFLLVSNILLLMYQLQMDDLLYSVKISPLIIIMKTQKLVYYTWPEVDSKSRYP